MPNVNLVRKPSTDTSTGEASFRDTFPAGVVFPFAGSVAPDGWLLCDGSAINRVTYSRLFAMIGTTYGVGDGSTTFNLPNTQGIFLKGAGSQTISAITYIGTLGTKEQDQIQGHQHSITDSGHDHGYAVGNTGSGTAGPNSGQGINNNYSTYRTTSVSTGLSVNNPSTDTVNGTPRTGSITRPANIAMQYIIKL